jgi:kynureninase
LKLTGLFVELIKDRLGDAVNIITPLDKTQRGCQLSLEIAAGDGQSIHHALEEGGVRTDWREPNVIRAAPVPLYNSFEEVWRFVDRLAELLG